MNVTDYGISVPEYKWANEVKRLYDYTCVNCGKTATGRNMHAHHIVPRHENETLSNILENGVALCHSCHWRIHASGGGGISNSPYARKIMMKIQEIKECEIIITVTKEQSDWLISKSAEYGISVNDYILRLIDETMHRDRLHNSADNDAELREKALALLKQYADAGILPAHSVNFRCMDLSYVKNEKEGGD